MARSTALEFATGARPVHLALGDLNTDGKLDVATVNASANTVSILLGNGDGTFKTWTDIAVAGGPNSIATGDFNKDSKLDLAVASQATQKISLLLGPARAHSPCAHWSRERVMRFTEF